MRTRTRNAAAVGLGCLLLTAAVPAQAADDGQRTGQGDAMAQRKPLPTRAERCQDRAPTKPEPYLGDEKYLGPRKLPTTNPKLAAMLHGYGRWGSDKTLMQFVSEHWDAKAREGKGGWKYPPQDGFELDPNGQPIKHPMKLEAKTVIDRFGYATGAFFSPAGTPYAARALPPSSLNTVDRDHTGGYRKYRVMKPVPVEAGTIAKAFGQPGGGQQYLVNPAGFSPEELRRMVPSWQPGSPLPKIGAVQLCEQGYLEPTT